jgi:di/tricarboxylate transporter
MTERVAAVLRFGVLFIESPIRLGVALVKASIELIVILFAAEFFASFFTQWGLAEDIPQSLIDLIGKEPSMELLLLFLLLMSAPCWSPIDKDWITEPGLITQAV